MQTFELIYRKLSEYYGFAILDEWLWYLMQTFCISVSVFVCVYAPLSLCIFVAYKCKPPAQVQHWQLFYSFDIYRCFNAPPSHCFSLSLYFCATIVYMNVDVCECLSALCNHIPFHCLRQWFVINGKKVNKCKEKEQFWILNNNTFWVKICCWVKSFVKK